MAGKLQALFASLTHGVYVIGVADGESSNAFTAAWLMQASFDPPMLALSINPNHASYQLLKVGGCFSVNVLSAGQKELALHFAKSMASNKLASVKWRQAGSGSPILDDAMAWFDCRLTGECPAGDHVLAWGQVIDGGLEQPASKPMNYLEMSGMDRAASLLPDTFRP